METFECIEKRRSVRKYMDSPIEWEKICNIIHSAQLAPSSGNVQDVRFVVVTDKKKRVSLANASLKQHWMAQAPVIIVVYAVPKLNARYYGLRGEKLYSIQNSSAAAENLLLAATDEGLASCWVGAFDEQMVNNVLGAPGDARPQVMVTLGYSDEEPKLPRRERLIDVVYLNGYGSKIVNPDLLFDNYGEAVKKKIIAAKNKIVEEGPGISKTIFEKAKEHINKLQKSYKDQQEEKQREKDKKLSKEIGDEEEILDEENDNI